MGLLVVSIWKSDGGTTVPPISRGNGHQPAWYKVAVATDPERSEGAIKKRPNYLIAVNTLSIVVNVLIVVVPNVSFDCDHRLSCLHIDG